MKKRHIVIQFFILLIVIAAIAAWTSIRTNQINAKTYQGTVQLSGYVNSNKSVDKAAEIVKKHQRSQPHKELSNRETEGGEIP